MQTNRNRALLHLSLIDKVGIATVKTIVRHQADGWDWSDLYQMTVADFATMGMSHEQSLRLIEGLADKKLLERELELIEKNDFSWVTVVDPSYPKLLNAIHLPPIVLYWRGAPLSNIEKKIAIVGARKADWYGQKVIAGLVPDLVGNGWSVVSGGAIGADSMAHKATLKAKGKTVAVLGSGLLRPYPACNRRLFEEIVASDGSVISCFPLEMEALPGNFPARNRIIAGLSQGCIVVQAAKKSGARITARFALDQGREVFAVPGLMGDELSVGCHELIQEGAKLIQNVADILVEFNEVCLSGSAEQQDEANTPSGKARGLVGLCAGPMTIDDLLGASELSLAELHTQLFEQQLAGRLKQTPTGAWVRC